MADTSNPVDSAEDTADGSVQKTYQPGAVWLQRIHLGGSVEIDAGTAADGAGAIGSVARRTMTRIKGMV